MAPNPTMPPEVFVARYEFKFLKNNKYFLFNPCKNNKVKQNVEKPSCLKKYAVSGADGSRVSSVLAFINSVQKKTNWELQSVWRVLLKN